MHILQKSKIVSLLISVSILLVSLSAFALTTVKKAACIDQSKCIHCGTCFKNCPVKAISKIEKDKKISYLIDPKKCIGCGTCIKNCPKKTISFTMADTSKALTTACGEKIPDSKSTLKK